MAHLWAKWLRHPCHLGDPHRFKAGGGEIRSGPLAGKVATSPLPSRGSPQLQSGGQNQKWPTLGKVATSPLPSRGSPPLQSGWENQKWPTCGQSGYVTPAVSGIPTAVERVGKSEVAHLWVKWLRHPCRLGDAHRCRAGGKIKSGPVVGKVGTSPLSSRGSPPLQSGGGGIKSGPLMGKVATSPLPSRGSPPLQSGGGGIRSGPLVGKVATSPLPSRGSPPLQSGWENQKWPSCGQSGYVTPAVSGIPTASERMGKSKVAHLWANRLCHPCRLGDFDRYTAGGKIRSGPLVGKVATPPLPSRGSPPLQSGWENQTGPTNGQSGYVTPAISGIPTGSGRGARSEMAHLWAKWLRHPCRLGDAHRFKAGGGGSEVAHLWAKWLRHPCHLGDPHRFKAGGGEIRSGPLVGKVATSPLPSRGSPPLQSGGQTQKWPTSGQSPCVTTAVSGIPTASERGENQKWPTYSQSGYVTPAVLGIPTASERVGKSKVAHLWATWLRHPCRVGDPHRFRAGGKIIIGPLVGKPAMSPVPSRRSPPLQSGGQNQKWPTSGQTGYVTPTVSGIPTASERGAKSEMAHLWAKWPRQPCRLGDLHRCRAGGKIRSGPLVGKIGTSRLRSRVSPPLQSGGEIRSDPLMGKVATSPLPSRGSPPLQSGGGNQKWPTCGQRGYVTPAVSGIPTAAERGAKSEVAHMWAKSLRHHCRLGDPHRFRAGGKI